MATRLAPSTHTFSGAPGGSSTRARAAGWANTLLASVVRAACAADICVLPAADAIALFKGAAAAPGCTPPPTFSNRPSTRSTEIVTTRCAEHRPLRRTILATASVAQERGLWVEMGFVSDAREGGGVEAGTEKGFEGRVVESPIKR